MGIVGLYRDESGRIQKLISDTNEIIDKGIANRVFEYKLVPIEIEESDLEWATTENLKALPREIQEMVLSGKRFLTCTEPAENQKYYLLMGAPKDDLRMARMGVLMEKSDDQISPVIATLNDEEYIVEIKGVGCPLGGFPDFHRRKQAGTDDKYHIRITGGLGLTGALNEFYQLERMRELKDRFGIDHPIKAVGVTGMTIESETDSMECGLLMRLSPSTIRFSFSGNPEIERVNSLDNQWFYYNAGRETAKFLCLNSPSIHRNLGINNMVRVSEKQYVLTDFEELTSISSGHCNLDITDQVYPEALKHNPLREIYWDTFRKGFVAGAPNDHSLKREVEGENGESADQFNDAALAILAPTIMQERLNGNRLSLSHLREIIGTLKSYFPEDYFAMPLKQWIKEKGLSLIAAQKSELDRYRDLLKSQDIDTVNRGIQEKLGTLGHTVDEYGCYINNRTIASQFLRELDSENESAIRIQKIQEIEAATKDYLKNEEQPLKRDYITPLFSLRYTLEFMDFNLLFNPLIGWALTYLYNENQLMKGVIQNAKDTHLIDIAQKNHNEIKQKIAEIHATPDKLHERLCDSVDDLLDWLTTD